VPKLYELAEEFDEIYREISEADPDEDFSDEIKEKLRKAEGDFEDKLIACVKVMKSLAGESDVCRNEAERLTKRARSLTRNAGSLKDYVKECMLSSGMLRVKSSLFNISIADNPPSVDVFDLDDIPDEFTVFVPRKVSKTDIKLAIERGEEVPGAKLVRSQGVRIR